MNAGTVSGYFHPGGMYGGYSGYYEWIDYCPNCGHYNCLLINPKGTYEGELTCGVCDSDFDGCTGADKHADGAWGWLSPYEEPEPVVVTEYVAPQPTHTTISNQWGSITLENHKANALQNAAI